MQFRRKQKLAEQLKQQQAELAEKQRERESQLKTLKSEVSMRKDPINTHSCLEKMRIICNA